MRYVFIRAEKASYPVKILCQVLRVSTSGFCAWLRRKPSARELRDRRLRTEIAAIHKASRKTYGSPRVHSDFKARKVAVSRKRVARLMREAGLVGVTPRPSRSTTDSDRELLQPAFGRSDIASFLRDERFVTRGFRLEL